MNCLNRKSVFVALVLFCATTSASLVSAGTIEVEELQRLDAFDALEDDNFGSDVKIDGDLMVVGARDTQGKTGSNWGSMYVYRLIDGVWTFEQKLIADEPQDFGELGDALDIDAEAGVIVGGAQGDSNPAEGGGTIALSGAAYVFRHDGKQWVQEQRLAASDPFIFDAFGSAVAVDGNRILVGARHEGTACDDSGDPFVHQNCRSGAAYVFEFDGKQWIETAKLIASDTEIQDLFGQRVDLVGDIAIIAAHNNGNTTPSCTPTCTNIDGYGSVYIFELIDGKWIEQDILTGDDTTIGAWDLFGQSISFDGQRIAVGATGDDDEFFDNGAAYIFVQDPKGNGMWILEQKVTASDAMNFDRMGNGIAIDGDLMIVGTESDDFGSIMGVGSAYLFVNDGESWIEQGKLVMSDGQEFDFAAHDLALGSGYAAMPTVLSDHVASNAGAVYLYASTGDCDGDGTIDMVEIATGESADENGDGVPDACNGVKCVADLDGSGDVGPADLAQVLGNWGACKGCPADLTGDGDVGPADLAQVLGAWGPCP